jgi:6-phosphogluconolactonase
MSSTTEAHHLYVGTYTKRQSRGIYSVRLDVSTGKLSEPTLAAETGNPSFLTFSPDKRFLHAVNDSDALAVSFAVGHDGQLRPVGIPLTRGSPAPSHIAVDRTGQMLLVSHFGNGYVAALPVLPDGTIGPPSKSYHQGQGLDPVRQASPHPHSVTIAPDNRFALVCDLGLDKVFSYALNPGDARLASGDPGFRFISTAPGAGPRHSAFSPDGRHFYVINELGGTISAYLYGKQDGTLSLLGSVSTLPSDFTGQNTTAEVCVHPQGHFVYGSNRGHESIAVFARDQVTGLLSPVEIVPCGGQHPRHFSLSPDGGWLVCANMNSDSLTVFRVDATSGRLTRVDSAASLSMPVCVLFHN